MSSSVVTPTQPDILDTAISKSLGSAPSVASTAAPTTVAPVSRTVPAAPAALATPATNSGVPSGTPDILDAAIAKSLGQTQPTAGYQPDEEKAGVAGGLMEPQANAAVGIANLIGRGAEIMMGKPKGSLTGTVSHEQPLSTTGEIGKLAGDASQWFAGEGGVSAAAEHLTGLAETATEIQAAAKFIKSPAAWAEYLKESPKAAWLLKAISGVAQGSAVGAGIGTVQGSATGNTLQGAESGAKAGAVAGAVAPALEGVKQVVNPWAAARISAWMAKLGIGETTEAGVASAVSKIAAKAGVPEGTAATVAPSAEGIQPNLQQGIRNSIKQAAAANGFEDIPDSVSVRDAAKFLGDQAYARSKATFDAAYKATGVNFTDLKNNIFKLENQISEEAIRDPEKAGQLLQQKEAYEAQAEQGMKLAKSKGVDVTQARNDWNLQLRADELSKHIRNSAEGTLANPTINPDKLATRLQKMNEAEVGQELPKLTQLLGDDAAGRMVAHAENAREAESVIKNFESLSSTDLHALQEIIAPKVSPGKFFGATVNWNGALGAFDKLPADERAARFTNPSAVRAALRAQATWQSAQKAAVSTVKAVTRLGTVGEIMGHAAGR